MLDKADRRGYTETPRPDADKENLIKSTKGEQKIMMTQIPTNPPHRYWWRFWSTKTDTFLTGTFQSGQECVQP